MLSAWFGGMQAGFVATILSALAIYYFVSLPYYSFVLKSWTSIVGLLFFVIEGGIVSLFIDSGYRYRKIHLYQKREEEAKATISSLQKELKKAKEETALRDEFLAITSHELKTPLTTVVLQLQTTLHNIRNVSLSEFSVEHLLTVLQSMQGQTKRLSQMINDLLDISLITTHRMALETEDVDLVTLLHDIADSFKEKLAHEQTMLTVSAKDTLFGKWDKFRLEQVFDNLISNAIKYGNKNPIHIEISKQDNQAVIRVRDGGIGIKDAEKKQIFSLFNRGTHEKEYKGLGIGLYIAQQIVLLHGGKIELKSSYGKGTTFTVFLPITSVQSTKNASEKLD